VAVDIPAEEEAVRIPQREEVARTPRPQGAVAGDTPQLQGVAVGDIPPVQGSHQWEEPVPGIHLCCKKEYYNGTRKKIILITSRH
jgi:hypothetical protein